jgi:hypothetical protein
MNSRCAGKSQVVICELLNALIANALRNLPILIDFLERV